MAIKEFVSQFFSLKFLFGLFEMRTSMYYLDRGLRLGQAEYIATGRTYSTMNSNFTNLYSLYAHSHFYFAMEILSMSFVYALFTRQVGNMPPNPPLTLTIITLIRTLSHGRWATCHYS